LKKRFHKIGVALRACAPVQQGEEDSCHADCVNRSRSARVSTVGCAVGITQGVS
jgi:hypothetical protein